MTLLHCYVVMDKDTGALKGTYVARDKVEVLDLWLKDQGFANVVEFAAAHTFGPLLNLDIIPAPWVDDLKRAFHPEPSTVPGWIWEVAMKVLQPMANNPDLELFLDKLRSARISLDRLIECLEKQVSPRKGA